MKMHRHFQIVSRRNYPLASGNCGIFAAELSKKLDEFKIDHDVEVFTDSSKGKLEEVAFATTINNKKVPCHHMVVRIGENIVDYSGICDEDFLRKYMNLFWHIPSDSIQKIKVIHNNTDELLEYAKSNCAPWGDHLAFREYIDNNLKPEMCII